MRAHQASARRGELLRCPQTSSGSVSVPSAAAAAGRGTSCDVPASSFATGSCDWPCCVGPRARWRVRRTRRRAAMKARPAHASRRSPSGSAMRVRGATAVAGAGVEAAERRQASRLRGAGPLPPTTLTRSSWQVEGTRREVACCSTAAAAIYSVPRRLARRLLALAHSGDRQTEPECVIGAPAVC